MDTAAGVAGNRPSCGNCGYDLTGLTDSSKCPECGRPLVEVLTRPSFGMNSGRRYRSKATLFGWPVLHIAVGPKDGEPRGHARGIIAIGDIATGGIAVGGMARGVVAVGGMAIGVFAVGGLAVGLLSGLGGMATGTFANGGGAIGILAAGGGAAGIFAQGGGALGVHVRDGRTAIGPTGTGNSPFDHLTWFFGTWPPDASSMINPLIVTAGLPVIAAAIIGLVALLRLRREPGAAEEPAR